MALMLLQVLVLGVLAAAADEHSIDFETLDNDVPLTWYWSSRALLPCSLPDGARAQPRRPLPLRGSDPETAPYTWRRDGVNYTHRVLGNGTLDVRKREGGDGVYQCTAALRGRGAVLGYPIRLQTAHLDKFSRHPENTTGRLGQPVTLSCVISSAPPASVSWLRDDQDLPADDRYYLLKNQLLITDVRRSDAGMYRCIATNTYLNKNRTSHAGRLHVAYSEPRALEFLTTFEDQQLMVQQGGDVVLPCPAVGWPRPEPEVTWELLSPDGQASRLYDTAQVLVITDVDIRHEGVYTCRAPGLEKAYNVTVTRPVNITLPPVSKEAIRASTIRFNCTASGKPAPNVTWYKDGVPLALTGTVGMLKAAFSDDRIELVINSITSKDAGVYQCFASNNVTTASAWATLTVTGPAAAAPQNVTCAPVGAKEVAVRWASVGTGVLAYTIHTTPQGPDGTQTPLGQPVRDTHAVVPVVEALMPYRFQVRAYMQGAKGAATDFSEFVVCQGQGVPINLAKLDQSVVVTWQNFAQLNPGVVQWILETREVDQIDVVTNITLDGSVTNYTLDVPEDGDLQVRVLGSRSVPWLRQNLTGVPWHSLDLSTGDRRAKPRNLEVTRVGARSFSVHWETDDLSPMKYKFLVCATKVDGSDDICQQSETNSVSMENLTPGSDYEVRVETQIQDLDSAEAVLPYRVSTLAEEAASISYKFINATAVRVSWNGAPGRYTVRHRQQPPPMGDWASVDTDGNTVLLTGIDPNAETHVEVISHEATPTTKQIIVPPQLRDLDAKDLSYVYTRNGITVSWAGAGPRVVKFAQNITQPLEKWHVVNVTESHVQLAGLDPALVTYVTVTARGTGGQVLTIPARPPPSSALTIGVGIGCAVCVLLLLLAALALLVWRRRKMAASPVRSRRRNASPTEGHEGETSELKNIGGRLANGGAAGEPLLNGHVHITENPTSKTPNGKIKKVRYEAFDVSRHDADTTAETVLEPDSSASFTLLDTSRRSDLDPSRSSRDLSADNSFSKLPDDNMNSEITRSSEFALGNSKILPTLQPNG